MGIIIRDLKIPAKNYFLDYNLEENIEDSDSSLLTNLSKINIFIGENNSGKSRLLRSLIFDEDHPKLEFKPYDEDLNNIIDNLDNLITEFTDLTNDSINNDVKSILKSIIDKIELKDLLIEDKSDIIQGIIELNNYCKEYREKNKGSNTAAGIMRVTEGDTKTNQLINADKLSEILIEIFLKNINLSIPIDKINSNFKFKKIYIPILRGLRPLNQENIDLYSQRTLEDYFSSGQSHMIFTGLNAYKTIRSHLLGNLKERKLIEEFQDYLAKQFFDENPVALIPQENGDEILRVKIGDEIEKSIFDLGDGIQSIIIMTLPLFLNKDNIEPNENVLIFIEEPEQLLHPGLQRKLMDTFYDEKFDKFQFFITTHSNHFLDITLDYDDVSLFFLRKEFEDSDEEEKIPNFLIEPLSYGDSNALEILGVRNTSVFLSNCTIWIEGVTDRYYIKKYFDVYQNYMLKKAQEKELEIMEFREDYHYSFVEYSGGNITHWSFLDNEDEIDEEERMNVDRVCGKLFLIADSDNKTTGKKAERNQKLAEKLSENFCLLKVKEIENLLSPKVIIEVIKDYECDSENRDCFKNDAFEENDYSNECLGKFIEETILKGNRNRTGSYQKKNNDGNCVTIKDKLKFSKLAISHINKYSDLSSGAKGLCNCLYKFIAKNNGYDITDYNKLCLNIPTRSSACKDKEEILDE